MRLGIDEKSHILKLYPQGYSAQEIVDKLKIKVTVRSIQRFLAKEGITRSVGDSFRIAVKKGRVRYYTSPNKTKRKKLDSKYRFEVLKRDGFKCVICGNTADNSRLQVDHINENKNDNNLNNLQTLCEECNKGKAYNSNPFYIRKDIRKTIHTPKEATKVVKDSFSGLCKHGSMLGLCKQGCK